MIDMINFSKFNQTNDIGLNIKNALLYCKENGEDMLVFDKGIYRISGESVVTKTLSVSNHSHGDRKVCFWLEGFSDFTIDFGGSEIILEDQMIAVVLQNSKNVTLKNFSVYNEVTFSREGVVLGSDENGFSFEIIDGKNVYTDGKNLYAGEPDGVNETLVRMNEWGKETGLLVPYQTDTVLCRFRFTELGENRYRADYLEESKVRYTITEGSRICMQPGHRNSCGIFISGSANTKIVNYTIHNTMGMGVIAQNSENIEIDSMQVTPKDDCCYTLNADATHFVHCKGLIHIHDCLFERQLDDALNVHGIYLRIVEKKENSVVLKHMHWQAINIDTVKKGSVLETCDPESLIPKKRYRVKEVKKLDLERVEVFFEDDISDVEVGDDMNEVSDVCEVLFENNLCRNNRARAVLLASAGKTILRGNRFETSGRAILFEADGGYWFESGGTTDVQILGNTFYNCNYIAANNGAGDIITTIKRKKIEEGKYFHKRIEVSGNRFINCGVTPVSINNAEEFIFCDNVFENCARTEAVVEYVKEFKTSKN